MGIKFCLISCYTAGVHWWQVTEVVSSACSLRITGMQERLIMQQEEGVSAPRAGPKLSRSNSPECQFLPLQVVLGKMESAKQRCTKSHKAGVLSLPGFKLLSWSVHLAGLGRYPLEPPRRGIIIVWRTLAGIRLSHPSPLKCFTSDLKGFQSWRNP